MPTVENWFEALVEERFSKILLNMGKHMPYRLEKSFLESDLIARNCEWEKKYIVTDDKGNESWLIINVSNKEEGAESQKQENKEGTTVYSIASR